MWRLLFVLALAAFSGSGCAVLKFDSLFTRQLTEVTLQQEPGRAKDKILIVDLSGSIANVNADSWLADWTCSPDYVRAVLNKAEQDRDVKAVLLRVNSPGGDVGATDTIAYEVRRYSRQTGVPVFAHILDTGASGGYYVACSAERIYAQPTAVVGSIGVIAVLPKLKGLADKVGYEQTVIKSGRLKDLGNPMRDLTGEERQLFQDMIDSMYGRFLEAVAAGRPAYTGQVAALRPLADGRVYTARQALDAQLIDGIAYLDEVLLALKQRARLERVQVIAYSFNPSPDATCYSSSAPAPRFGQTRFELPGGLRGATMKGGFYYLWLPGE